MLLVDSRRQFPSVVIGLAMMCYILKCHKDMQSRILCLLILVIISRKNTPCREHIPNGVILQGHYHMVVAKACFDSALANWYKYGGVVLLRYQCSHIAIDWVLTEHRWVIYVHICIYYCMHIKLTWSVFVFL